MNQLFRWDQTGLFLLALAAGILPFAVPEVCAAALREGLTLCSGPLLISLFPFLVVSRLLIQCPESDLLALPFRLAAWGIGIRTPCAARVLCIGFLGGFAPAASAAAQAVRTGQLTAEEADALLPACICSGPSFVVLTVGQSLLGSGRSWRAAVCVTDHRKLSDCRSAEPVCRSAFGQTGICSASIPCTAAAG